MFVARGCAAHRALSQALGVQQHPMQRALAQSIRPAAAIGIMSPTAAFTAAPFSVTAAAAAATNAEGPGHIPAIGAKRRFRPLRVIKNRIDILHDPLYNKGSGYKVGERDRLGLRGLVPPRRLRMTAQPVAMIFNDDDSVRRALLRPAFTHTHSHGLDFSSPRIAL